jgi:DNA-binding SARP family transcriptional activator/TolB-like protein/Flp pilus assembly protein TadD
VVELRTLGTLQLSASDGRDLEPLARQSKRTALLIYLAAAVPNGLHRRDTLLALFWPELDETHARAALSQALYVLRNELGEQAIVTRGDTEVGLSGDVVWCDVRAFEAALDAGQPTEALALYRGALLDGFFLSDVPEFERWLERERDRLRDRAAIGGWALAEASAAAGDVFEAERWARWAAALAPADEAVIRRLMTFLRGQGDRAAALRAYAAYTLTLKQEYELEPSAETRALAETIRLERPLASADAPIHLQPVSGRSAEPTPRRTPRGRAIAAAAIGVLLITAGWWGIHAAGAGGGPIHRLAVLPLENLTGDTTQAYFVEGIHDALVTELAKISALSVISRTSVLGYRHTTKTAPEIARELHVDAIVEGSVVLAGDSVRVTAQLIAGPTDRHLWAGTYVKNRRNVLELYSDVTQAIAQEVRVALTPEERARLTSARPVDPAANDLYLKGRYFCDKWTEGDMNRGIAFYHRAIDQDPTFAPAYAGLGECYANFTLFGFAPPQDISPKAKAAVTRALELDPTLGPAYSTLGLIKYQLEIDWPGADSALRRAAELAPSAAYVHLSYSGYLIAMGRLDSAIAEAQRAIELDPLTLTTSLNQGWTYFMARRYTESIAQLKETLEFDTTYAYAHMELAWNYVQLGRFAEATQECAIALRGPSTADAQFLLGSCGWVYGHAGRRADALDLLKKLRDMSERRWVDPYNVAYVYEGLGDIDQGIAWLRRTIRERSPAIMFLKTDPHIDGLRADPRFPLLLQEVGLRN